MSKEFFEKRKEELIRYINDILLGALPIKTDRESMLALLRIINQYSFENRLDTKGLLTRTIIDSLELEYSIGEKFIEFDQMIK